MGFFPYFFFLILFITLTETEYAHQTGKKIIPLKMECGYEADGWLGSIIENNLQYDFSGRDPLEKTVNQVIAAIQKELNRKNGVVVDLPKPIIQSEHGVNIWQITLHLENILF